MERVFLKLYDPADIYIAPSGEVMNEAKVLEHFPAAQFFSYIVHTDAGGEMMYGFYALSAMRSKYGVNPGLDNIQACQIIEDAMNAEREQQDADMQAASEIITPEERIAAVLEFQTLNSLPNVE